MLKRIFLFSLLSLVLVLGAIIFFHFQFPYSVWVQSRLSNFVGYTNCPQDWSLGKLQKRPAWISSYNKELAARARRVFWKSVVLGPGARAHVAIHAVVESQVAMGEPAATAEALQRLVDQGMERHEAVHRVGQVVAELMHAAMTGAMNPLEVNDELARRVKELG